MNQIPVDPRTKSGLPSLGTLPIVQEWNAGIFRVVAPNASTMTLDGTNTYVFCDLREGAAVIVDPGPISSSHLGNVLDILEKRSVQPVGIILTHHHLDHSEAAKSWSDTLQVGVSAAMASLVSGTGVQLTDGDIIPVGNLFLKAISTPGHVSDHLAFQTGDGFILTGDHILGRSTSVIAYPDGDVEKYLDSLIKVRNLGSQIILPGHGPEISNDLSPQVVEYYIEHRKYRIDQIEKFLKGAVTADIDQLTSGIYGFDSNEPLFPPARLSTLAALKYLVDQGTAVADGGGFYSIVG